MSLLDKIRESFQNKTVSVSTTPTSATVDAQSFVNTTSDLGIKKKEYLEEFRGWVASAVDAIADQIANIDIRLFEMGKNDDVKEITEHEALDVLHRINNFTTKFDHFWLASAYLELTGESPWLVDEEDGKVVNLFFLIPTNLRPIVDSDRNIIGYEYMAGHNRFKLRFEDVIFLKFPDPANPTRGKGTLEKAASIVDVDNFSELWNKTFYKNSARPDSIIGVKIDQMSDEQKDKLKASLKEQYSGTKNAHKTMILFGEMDFHKSGFNQKDMDFLEQQKFSRDKILGIFRVPKAIVSQTDGVNLANAKTAIDIFLKFTIKPKMERIIQQLNEFYLPLFENTENLFFSFVDPSPQDIETKSKVFEKAVNKWMTINEARAEINLSDVEGGDTIYLPFNIGPIGSVPLEPKQLTIKSKNKFTNIANISGRILQLKARNSKYFKNQKDKIKLKGAEKEIKESIKEIIKSEVYKKPKKKEKPKKEEKKDNQWNEEDKLDFWKKKIAFSEEHLTEMNEIVESEFVRQRKQVMKDFNDLKSKKQTTKEVFDAVKLNEKKETKLMLEATFEINEEIFKDSADDTFTSIGVDQVMDTSTDEVQKILNELGNRTYKSVNATTNDKINKAIADGLSKGESLDEVQDRVRKFFVDSEKFRADRIAKTETVRYTNEASQQAFIDSGVVEQKEWFVNPGACFVAGSQVLKYEDKKIQSVGIETLNPGDKVIGSSGTPQRVTAIKSKVYKGDIVCGAGFAVTPEHKFLTADGSWRAIGEYAIQANFKSIKNFFISKTKNIVSAFQKVVSLPFIFRGNFGFGMPVYAITKNNEIPIFDKKIDDPFTIKRNLFFKGDIIISKQISHSNFNVSSSSKILTTNNSTMPRTITSFKSSMRKISTRLFEKRFITSIASKFNLRFILRIINSFMSRAKMLTGTKMRTKSLSNLSVFPPFTLKNLFAPFAAYSGKFRNERILPFGNIMTGSTTKSSISFNISWKYFAGLITYFTFYICRLHKSIISHLVQFVNSYEGFVYDIEVENDRSFTLASGLVAHNCELCRPLNGKRLPLEGNYFDKGDTITGELGRKLELDFDTTEAPPLHVQCKCIIIPVFIQTRSVKKKKLCECGQTHDVNYHKEIKKQKKNELDEALKLFDEDHKKTKKTNEELEQLRQNLIKKHNEQVDEE